MNTEKISIIKVSRSVYYYPYVYLEHCKECNMTPTQEGFVDFIRPQIYDWIEDEFIREMVTIELQNLNKDT